MNWPSQSLGVSQPLTPGKFIDSLTSDSALWSRFYQKFTVCKKDICSASLLVDAAANRQCRRAAAAPAAAAAAAVATAACCGAATTRLQQQYRCSAAHCPASEWVSTILDDAYYIYYIRLYLQHPTQSENNEFSFNRCILLLETFYNLYRALDNEKKIYSPLERYPHFAPSNASDDWCGQTRIE